MNENLKKAQQVRTLAKWFGGVGAFFALLLLMQGSPIAAIMIGFGIYWGYKVLQGYAQFLERQSYKEVLKERLKAQVEHLVEDLQRLDTYLQVQEDLRYFNKIGSYGGSPIFKFIAHQKDFYQFESVSPQPQASGFVPKENKLIWGSFIYEGIASPSEDLVEFTLEGELKSV